MLLYWRFNSDTMVDSSRVFSGADCGFEELAHCWMLQKVAVTVLHAWSHYPGSWALLTLRNYNAQWSRMRMTFPVEMVWPAFQSFLGNLLVKEFWKLVYICRSYDLKSKGLFLREFVCCTLQSSGCGENSEYTSYNDWIVIDSSKQNFVAKPFHVNEVGTFSPGLSSNVAWQ